MSLKCTVPETTLNYRLLPSGDRTLAKALPDTLPRYIALTRPLSVSPQFFFLVSLGDGPFIPM